uniref:Uncharacterized protein n=2 Tax=Enterococcus TaxID=1350 RepID=K7TA23_ENTTH|nr:hypothetical protein pJHW3_004 [Enterococcus thailandicus]AFW17893.1 hyprothetical protein [Enterococcus faecalis]
MRRSIIVKKIRDERLIIKNLKNIRLAFVIENVVILIILAIQLMNEKFTEVISLNNPLWFVIFIGSFSLVITSVNISLPMEDKTQKTSFFRILLYSLAIFITSFLFFYLVSYKNIMIALICGFIMFFCAILYQIYLNKFKY